MVDHLILGGGGANGNEWFVQLLGVESSLFMK